MGPFVLLAGVSLIAEHERDAVGREIVVRLVPDRRAELALHEIEHHGVALLDEPLRGDECADAELLDHLGNVGREDRRGGEGRPVRRVARSGFSTRNVAIDFPT